MDDVERIAAGLTKAQARRLTNLAELKLHGWQWTSKLGDRGWRTSRATTAVLAERLLVTNHSGFADLTPLGLRVAQHLKQENAK